MTDLLDNAVITVRQILAEMGRDEEVTLAPCGSCWIWDAAAPYDDCRWRMYLNAAGVDPVAVEFLLPETVEVLRRQAESLVHSFPGTLEHLARVGCDHAELVHKPIRCTDDIINWATSIYNACAPLSAGAPDPKQYPSTVLATVTLGRSDFCVVHPDHQGHLAVLPADGGRTSIYWASPGTEYAARLGEELGPRHPVSRAAWANKSSR